MIELKTGGIFGPHRECVDPDLKNLGKTIAGMLVEAELTTIQVQQVLGAAESILYHHAVLTKRKRPLPSPDAAPDEAEAQEVTST